MSLIDLINDTVSPNPVEVKKSSAQSLAERLIIVANRMIDGFYPDKVVLTPKQKLMIMTGDSFIFLEQSKQTNSKWAQLAIEGHRVVQVLRKQDKFMIGAVCDQTFTFYDSGKEFSRTVTPAPEVKAVVQPALPFDAPEVTSKRRPKTHKCSSCNKRRISIDKSVCGTCSAK